MKTIYGILSILFITATPVFAQNQQNANDIITQMQTALNLSQEQVYNITPVVNTYVEAMQELQKSIDNGSINQSAIDSQKQQLKAVEDQGLQEYLTANQISQWNYIQGQKDQQGNKSDADADVYSNYPRDYPPQN